MFRQIDLLAEQHPRVEAVERDGGASERFDETLLDRTERIAATKIGMDVINTRASGSISAISRPASMTSDSLQPWVPAGNTVELPMPRRDVADYLGLTVETISRTLSDLQNAAAIELPSSRRIVLRDRTSLRRLKS